ENEVNGKEKDGKWGEHRSKTGPDRDRFGPKRRTEDRTEMVRSGPGRSSVRSGPTRHNLRVFGKTGPDQRPNWSKTPDRGPDRNTFGILVILVLSTEKQFISNTWDNSSTSGWVFLLGGGVIFWASKKQTCIAGSTIESKFVALAAAGKEAEWLKK
nr:zinc finger, CCHC-type [Tanacetum cinerariifolium]